MKRILRAAAAALLIATAWPVSAANLRIDQEPAASALGSTDAFLCEQGVGTTNTTKNCTAAQVNTYVQSQMPTASSSTLGLAKCDGATILCSGGVMQSAATVVAGTTQTVTTAQWSGGTTFRVTTASQTLTLPVSSSLSANGGIAIQTVGQSVTLAPNAADAINGGSAGASITIASGLTAYVTTDHAGNIYASPISSSGGSGTVTSMSVVSANGLAGSVANPTTTPAVTLSTTVTGMVKGNGTALSAATADTDYQSPLTLTTTGTSGAATFSGHTLNIPQYTGGGGSGAISLVSTITFNNTTTFASWTGLTGNEYQLRCSGVISGNAAHTLGIQFGTGATPTWQTGSTAYQQMGAYVLTGTAGQINVTANNMMGHLPAGSGTVGSSFTANIHNLASSTATKSLDGVVNVYNGTAYIWEGQSGWDITDGATVITAVRYGDTDASAVSVKSGSCSLYAISN